MADPESSEKKRCTMNSKSQAKGSNMTVYLLVREYQQDRTSIIGVYSNLETAQTIVGGLIWEEAEGELVPQWLANASMDPQEPSDFVIYELVVDNTVDLY